MARKSDKNEEQLKKEREQRRAKLFEEAKQPLDTVIEENSDLSEREYGKAFKKMYSVLRKGLVHLKKQKQAKIKTWEEVYNDAQELIKKFSDF